MKKSTWLLLLVASLGYFVDTFDLVLFVVIGKSSLAEMGYSGASLDHMRLLLFDIQMVGLLIGGVVFGILGDKKGRLSVLFASIILYSVCNIINGFISDIYSYSALRFLAGVGLAGELGVGVTIVAETMPQKIRGYGTSILAATGVLGAVVAGLIGDAFYWRYAFFIGGALGILLLLLRIGTYESDMFLHASESKKERGNILKLIRNPKSRKIYLLSLLVGIPVFFVVTILMQMAPSLAQELGIKGTITTGKAVVFIYLGLAFGDVLCGVVSQKLQSRKKAIGLFQVCSLLISLVYLNLHGQSAAVFYAVCVLMGISTGYWIVMITMGAEQFGTNIRSTVATTIPNFVRGAAIPISMLYGFIGSMNEFSIVQAAIITGLLCFSLAIYANFALPETFHKDLDYLED
ncbi:MFS transporter [Arcticibacterium luteifluviistationis]|uniref:MFS transporter n=1 Tax=Arcticibacterium luteifluviistationis TaxID=1784714 RepID=A0A2Z4GAJ4_9BACT|nr:MFS transporter [Arcticibacterium luteifluviistationis]AWV97953.1 MFS transporter [Arcticibacterium luteifluviistationis]